MKIDLRPITVITCIGLTACGSDVDDDHLEATNVLNQWGIIATDAEEEVEIFARFGQFDSDLSRQQFEADLLPVLDACEVKTEAPLNDEGEEIGDGDDDRDFEFSVAYSDISAGETVIISSPAGTYSTLSQTAENSSIQYNQPDGAALPGPAPAGMTADITGSAFPAFGNVNIPNVMELAIITPEEESEITVSTLFTWIPTNNPNAFLDISSSSVDEVSGIITTVECQVVDDGQFSFSAQTQSEMGNAFLGESPDYSRTIHRIDQSGKSALVVWNSVDI